MAIAVTGSTATHTTATSHTITLPTFAEGDTVIISAAWNGASGATTCDNGFTRNTVIDDTVTNFSDGTANPRLSVYEKRMTAADVAAQPLTVTITTTNAITSGVGAIRINDNSGKHYRAFHSRWTFSNSSTGTVTTDTLENLPAAAAVVGVVASHHGSTNHTVTTSGAVELWDTLGGKATACAYKLNAGPTASLEWTQATTASWMSWIMAFTPVPTPTGEQELLRPATEIAQLPNTGTEWTRVVANADDADPSVDDCLLTNLDKWGEATQYLAAALVYKRNGTASYKTKVETALRKIIGSDQIAANDGTTSSDYLLGTIRNLFPYIMAADLIAFDKTLTGTRTGWTGITWQEWLLGAYPESGGHIVDRLIGTQTRWSTMRKTAYNSASNWGSQARATLAAVAASTGDDARFAEMTRLWKASIGALDVDHFGYPTGTVPPHFEEDGFYVTAEFDTSFAYNYNGSANPPTQGTPSWQAINPAAASNPDSGIAIEDISRSAVSWPDYDQLGLDYSGEYMIGLFAHAVLIENYDASVWTEQSSGPKRALDFLYSAVGSDAYVGWNSITGVNSAKWVARVANLKYATSYTTGAESNVGAAGRMLAHGEWLFQSVGGGSTVPAAVANLSGTAGDSQVSLTWTAPDDGGAAITDYIVQYREVAEVGEPPAEEEGFLIPISELMAKPTSGAGWTALVAAADSVPSRTVTLADQNSLTQSYVLAAALVYARTGNASYQTMVIDAVKKVPGTENSAGDLLAVLRTLYGYVVAAELVGMSHATVCDNSQTWGTFLSLIRTKEIGSHGRWRTIDYTSKNTGNNWGAYAISTDLAVSLALNDTAGVDRDVQILRKWIGMSNTAEAFQPTSGYTTDNLGALWDMTPVMTYAINPIGDPDRSGAIIEDALRGGGAPGQVAPAGVTYQEEALDGILSGLVLLKTHGVDLLPGGTEALKRAYAFMIQSGGPGPYSLTRYLAYAINHLYGTSWPELTETTPYRHLGFGAWLFS